MALCRNGGFTWIYLNFMELNDTILRDDKQLDIWVLSSWTLWRLRYPSEAQVTQVHFFRMLYMMINRYN